MRIIARVVNNLPTNFGVSRTFRCQFIGQPLTLIVTAVVGDAGLMLCLSTKTEASSEDIGHLLYEH